MMRFHLENLKENLTVTAKDLPKGSHLDYLMEIPKVMRWHYLMVRPKVNHLVLPKDLHLVMRTENRSV